MDQILTDKRRFCEHQFTEESYGYECKKCGYIQMEKPWPEIEVESDFDACLLKVLQQQANLNSDDEDLLDADEEEEDDDLAQELNDDEKDG